MKTIFSKKTSLSWFCKFFRLDDLRICFCLNKHQPWLQLFFNFNQYSMRPFQRALAGFNNLGIHRSSREFNWVCMSKIPSPHFQMESWTIAFSIFSLINFGIEYIWPIYQSLDKEIWFTISFFFIPRELHSVHFFSWATHLYMSLFPSVQPSVCQSVCRAPYLKSHTSSNYHFWYTCVKWWYLLGSYGGGGGKRAKNSSKWKITITSVTHYISRTV